MHNLNELKLIKSFIRFRRVKWEQRKLAEQNTMLIDVAQVQISLSEDKICPEINRMCLHQQVQTEMTQSLLEITQSHRALTKQMASLTEAVFELKTLMCRSCEGGRHSDQMATAPSTFSKKIQMSGNSK